MNDDIKLVVIIRNENDPMLIDGGKVAYVFENGRSQTTEFTRMKYCVLFPN